MTKDVPGVFSGTVEELTKLTLADKKKSKTKKQLLRAILTGEESKEAAGQLNNLFSAF